jgi:hypothetical protein
LSGRDVPATLSSTAHTRPTRQEQEGLGITRPQEKGAGHQAPGTIRVSEGFDYFPKVDRKRLLGVPSPVTLSQPGVVFWVGEPV